jgi:hypothetical protein
MACKSCGSDNQSKFKGELAIHFSGRKGIDIPHVFLFPELLVCLKCGSVEFAISEDELRQLRRGDAAAAGAM